MGVGVYVNAIKELSDEEMFLIKSFNTLSRNGITIPQDLREKLIAIVGEGPAGQEDANGPDWQWEDEYYELRSKTVEIGVSGEGDVMYNDGRDKVGMVIQLEDIPPGTKALRIYAEA